MGPVDILVNNAGITRDSSFKKMSHEQWDAVLNTNLSSLYHMTHPVFEGMCRRGFGRIINISSINGQKALLTNELLRGESGRSWFFDGVGTGRRKTQITVNTISPGYIQTDMVMAMPAHIREAAEAQIPVGRGLPEDIGRAVAFLTADANDYITE